MQWSGGRGGSEREQDAPATYGSRMHPATWEREQDAPTTCGSKMHPATENAYCSARPGVQ